MEKSADVVAESEDHQQGEDKHPYDLGDFQELVARLASCDHFVKAEHDVASVKRGDGKKVHHSQHYRQQGKYLEEPEPVPCGREHLADRYEAAYRLVGLCLGRSDQFEVAEISSYGAERQFDTGRHGFQQGICLGRIRRDPGIGPDPSEGIDQDRDRQRVGSPQHRSIDRASRNLGKICLPG